jgi:hypothetical protein
VQAVPVVQVAAAAAAAAAAGGYQEEGKCTATVGAGLRRMGTIPRGIMGTSTTEGCACAAPVSALLVPTQGRIVWYALSPVLFFYEFSLVVCGACSEMVFFILFLF